ncbi:MAG TPA: DUF1844 domain-containing protein [Phycisphaerae bacterium]|nr:DUF1844 domain-containing protein [Phycisphaerae bacterium]
MAEEEPKLHIDDDWKSQAAAEKERLAASVEAGEHREMPAASFTGLIQLIAMQAMVGLGGLAGPPGQEIPPNLELAKHHIDLLDVLDNKTKGNLTPEEKRLLDTTLHQLRMAYVESLQGGGPSTPPLRGGPR